MKPAVPVGAVIELEAVPELPPGSVVLDSFGAVWQRREDMVGRSRWHALLGPALLHVSRTWLEMFTGGVALTVLHIGAA